MQTTNTRKRIIKTIKIFLIIAATLFCIGAFLFRGEISNFILSFKGYSPKEALVTRDLLMRDIDIMQAKEGVGAQVLLKENSIEKLKNIENELFQNENGNIIHVSVMNRVFTDSKKPVEIRFLMRIMLYLRERKTGSEVGHIVGIAGGFQRNPLEIFESSQSLKMSVEEFEKLYQEANVSNLSTKKQIDKLTDLYVNNHGYWRRELFGRE